jgi:hypothetical protein
MLNEVLKLSNFHIGHSYSRSEIAIAGDVEKAGALGARGTGIAQFSNATLLLVTLDKRGREYTYEDRFEGERFIWDSQNQHTQGSKLIVGLLSQTIIPHLFVRVQEKSGSVTMPFVYCGRLLCLAVEGNEPVTCSFQALDYLPDAKGELSAVYKWTPHDQPSDDAAKRELSLNAKVSSRLDKEQRFNPDPRRRKSIELRAMEIAIRHYEDLGYSVENTSNFKAYDLLCVREGTTKRIEVKGTTSAGEAVFLTINEVISANNPAQENYSTDLFVVHSIKTSERDGISTATGGIEMKLENWKAHSDHLEPIAFKYSIHA